ncbi:MAG TPA: hypothetical protein VMU21_07165 [Thermodesulfovibrionales bacterium]|nr:hypothetical protein [Thermodesulfovibrionales bacterium]
MFVPLLTALHVTVVVLWIGGVAFVTIIIFPMLLKMEDSFEKVLLFQRVENRFAKQARAYAWTAGITGAILLYLTGQHRALFTLNGLGATVMLMVWLVYTLVLTFEKKIFALFFSQPEKLDAAKIFVRLNTFHWLVLGLSLAAVFIGVWTGHGGHF